TCESGQVRVQSWTSVAPATTRNRKGKGTPSARTRRAGRLVSCRFHSSMKPAGNWLTQKSPPGLEGRRASCHTCRQAQPPVPPVPPVPTVPPAPPVPPPPPAQPPPSEPSPSLPPPSPSFTTAKLPAAARAVPATIAVVLTAPSSAASSVPPG